MPPKKAPVKKAVAVINEPIPKKAKKIKKPATKTDYVPTTQPTKKDDTFVKGFEKAVKSYRTLCLKKMEIDFTYTDNKRKINTFLYETKEAVEGKYETITFKNDCDVFANRTIVVDLYTSYIVGFKLHKPLNIDGRTYTWYRYVEKNIPEEHIAAIEKKMGGDSSKIYRGNPVSYGNLDKNLFFAVGKSNINEVLNVTEKNIGRFFFVYPLLIAEPARNEELFSRMKQAFIINKKIDLQKVADIGQVWDGGISNIINSAKGSNKNAPAKDKNIQDLKKGKQIKKAPLVDNKEAKILPPGGHIKCLNAFDELIVPLPKKKLAKKL